MMMSMVVFIDFPEYRLNKMEKKELIDEEADAVE